MNTQVKFDELFQMFDGLFKVMVALATKIKTADFNEKFRIGVKIQLIQADLLKIASRMVTLYEVHFELNKENIEISDDMLPYWREAKKMAAAVVAPTADFDDVKFLNKDLEKELDAQTVVGKEMIEKLETLKNESKEGEH